MDFGETWQSVCKCLNLQRYSFTSKQFWMGKKQVALSLKDFFIIILNLDFQIKWHFHLLPSSYTEKEDYHTCQKSFLLQNNIQLFREFSFHESLAKVQAFCYWKECWAGPSLKTKEKTSAIVSNFRIASPLLIGVLGIPNIRK